MPNQVGDIEMNRVAHPIRGVDRNITGWVDLLAGGDVTERSVLPLLIHLIQSGDRVAIGEILRVVLNPGLPQRIMDIHGEMKSRREGLAFQQIALKGLTSFIAAQLEVLETHRAKPVNIESLPAWIEQLNRTLQGRRADTDKMIDGSVDDYFIKHPTADRDKARVILDEGRKSLDKARLKATIEIKIEESTKDLQNKRRIEEQKLKELEREREDYCTVSDSVITSAQDQTTKLRRAKENLLGAVARKYRNYFTHQSNQTTQDNLQTVLQGFNLPVDTIVDEAGNTLLHLAIEYSNRSAFDILMLYSPNCLIENGAGVTPMGAVMASQDPVKVESVSEALSRQDVDLNHQLRQEQQREAQQREAQERKEQQQREERQRETQQREAQEREKQEREKQEREKQQREAQQRNHAQFELSSDIRDKIDRYLSKDLNKTTKDENDEYVLMSLRLTQKELNEIKDKFKEKQS